jgi:hypothetical protein
LGIALALYPQSSPRTPVILISIDTLRADHLSAYGYRKIETPNIDAFARQGTVFEAIDSQIPLTLPSHTSLFTSTYPFQSGVEENDQPVPAGAVTLASVLRSNGYRTAAFVGSVVMDRRQGLDQGFDFYDSPFRGLAEESGNPFGVGVKRDGALVVRAARQWLGQNRSQPVFVFLHLYDLHAPYSHAPSPEGLPNTAGYDAEIGYVDRLLGQFQQALAGWMVGPVPRGAALGPRRKPRRPWRIEPRILHLREHAAGAADRALAGRSFRLRRPRRPARRTHRRGAHHLGFPENILALRIPGRQPVGGGPFGEGRRAGGL